MRNRVSRRETLRVLCLLPSQAQEHSWFSQPPRATGSGSSSSALSSSLSSRPTASRVACEPPSFHHPLAHSPLHPPMSFQKEPPTIADQSFLVQEMGVASRSPKNLASEHPPPALFFPTTIQIKPFPGARETTSLVGPPYLICAP